MSELEEKVKSVDEICKQFYPYFEKAKKDREDAELRLKKGTKTRVIISVVGAWILSDILVGISSMIGLPVVFGFLDIVIAIFVAAKVYNSYLKPNLTNEYNNMIKDAIYNEEKGNQIIENNISSLSILPDDYWYPLATNYIYKIVKQGRADSINQALQMYDEQLHRWKVEEANAAILSEQQSQSESLRGIRKSSAINAAANVVSATANVANLFR